MSPSRLLTVLAVVAGVALVVVGLTAPAGAIVTGTVPADEGQSGTVALEPTSGYAGLVEGELVVEIEELNDRATSTFDAVFAITAQEDQEIRLETDVEGVEFTRGDSGERLEGDDRLELGADEAVPIGMVVETTDGDPEGGTFTVSVESDSGGPTYAVGSRVFSGRLTALFAVPIALGVLLAAGVIRRRRDLWPMLP